MGGITGVPTDMTSVTISMTEDTMMKDTGIEMEETEETTIMNMKVLGDWMIWGIPGATSSLRGGGV